jgi:hypothetical protein
MELRGATKVRGRGLGWDSASGAAAAGGRATGDEIASESGRAAVGRFTGSIASQREFAAGFWGASTPLLRAMTWEVNSF